MGNLLLQLSVILLTQAAAPDVRWSEGEHFTGEWNGDRQRLAEAGLTFDLAYSVEAFASSAQRSSAAFGHLDAALTLDTQKLGLWPDGKLYILGQNNHGVGINTIVGSATSVSNLEAPPYTQLTELFYEQALFGNRVILRLGKQDANREFGTPRYGGNFINNNFGMFPTGPLPSYPTTGLGAMLVVQPTAWSVIKACVFEGNPMIGSFGFDSALAKDATVTTALGAGLTHRFGVDRRNGGTTSVGAWLQTGGIQQVIDVPNPQTFETNVGLMVQSEERIYSAPSNKENNGGLTVVARLGWSQTDRNEIPLYVGASVAWHGLGQLRDNDTIGLGFGYFEVNNQANHTPGRGFETFVELFYKMRITHFLSIQPDAQLYVHPGGDRPTTLIAGARMKLKL